MQSNVNKLFAFQRTKNDNWSFPFVSSMRWFHLDFGTREAYKNSKRYTTVKRYQKQYNDFSNQWFSNSKQLWTIQFLDYMSVGKFNMQNKFEVYLFYRFSVMWKRESMRKRAIEGCGWGECLRIEIQNFSCGLFDTLMNENENKTLLIVISRVFYCMNSQLSTLPFPLSLPPYSWYVCKSSPSSIKQTCFWLEELYLPRGWFKWHVTRFSGFMNIIEGFTLKSPYCEQGLFINSDSISTFPTRNSIPRRIVGVFADNQLTDIIKPENWAYRW